MLPHPADERVDLGVAPHPRREALECRELAFAPWSMADVPVDRRRVRPIRLHRDDIEAVSLDQPPRNGVAGAVELARPMACLAQQPHACVAEAVKELAERRV